MENTFASAAENAKPVLNKKKVNMEEFNKIVSESLNVESTIKEASFQNFNLCFIIFYPINASNWEGNYFVT